MRLDIIGADMITAQAVGRHAVFEAMLNGVIGVGKLRHLDGARYRGQYAYEIAGGGQSRSTQWLVRVVTTALDEARINPRSERVVVLVGTGLREQASLESWYCEDQPFALDGWDYRGALQAALGTDLRVFTFVNACSASLCCLSLAHDMLKLGQADAVVVAGTDSLTSSMYGLLDRANGETPEVIQPFDRLRKGVLMGEGAAAVVLRRAPSDGSRDVRSLGRLGAVVQNCDAVHETAPDPAGIGRVLRLAHDEAGIAPHDIDLILAHGTGTRLNDDTEALALADFYGDSAARVMLSGVKAMTGHTAGASGLISLITGIHIMQDGKVPPQPGLHDPIDAAARFDVVTERRDGCRVGRIQVDAFGFGGVNAVAILERADGSH